MSRYALTPTREEIAALPLSSNAKIAAELISHEGTRALDIGCGEGKFTRNLAKHFAVVKGIDVKATKIVQAQAAAVAENVDVVFATASGEAIPEVDGSFDVVIFSNSLHHMPNPDAALREAMRVLRAGGVLYVMEPVASGNYHDATCLVNDETQVRREAFDALRRIPNAHAEREILYRARRVFRDFEEWRDDQIDRDAKRKAKFDAQPEAVRERFMSNAQREGGTLAFDQVFRVNLLRKA